MEPGQTVDLRTLVALKNTTHDRTATSQSSYDGTTVVPDTLLRSARERTYIAIFFDP